MMRIPLIISLCAIGILAVVSDVSDFAKDYMSKNRWWTIPATITKTDYPVVYNLKDPYFEPQVEYKYRLGDNDYTGNRLAHTKVSPLLGYDMGKFSEEHPVGNTIEVYVEPTNAANSVLAPVDNPSTLISHLIAVGMFFSFVYFSLYPVVKPVVIVNGETALNAGDG